MIDWDELLEDVNWGRTISLLIIGIIVIVAVILVLMDHTRARNLERELEADLNKVELAKTDLQTPGQQKIKQIKQDISAMKSRIERNPVKIATEFNLEEVKTHISDQAARNDVQILSMTHKDWDDQEEGSSTIYRVNVEFTTRRLNDARNFIEDLDRLPYPLTVNFPQLNAGKKMECTVNIYVFNDESWSSENTCNPDIEFPDIPIEERQKSYGDIFLSFFKEDSQKLLEKIKRERAGLTDVKAEWREYCLLQNQKERLAAKIDILEKAGE